MTTHPAEPPHGIEPFAVLSALLALARTAVLRDHGLDEERWKAIEAGWAQRFQAEDGEALTERFRAVYAYALQNPDAPPCPPTEPTGAPRFLSSEPQPWREEAAQVPPVPRPARHPLAGTAAFDPSQVRPALPFTPPPRTAHPLAATLESPAGLPVTPALPFTKP